ncbi:MAG TPA: hypothetical protein VF220_00955 [Nitrososphaeraceae archaeon]
MGYFYHHDSHLLCVAQLRPELGGRHNNAITVLIDHNSATNTDRREHQTLLSVSKY